jgi:hypothetical protein
MQTTQETLTTAQDERLLTLLRTYEAGQPVLALRIGSQQDPGLRRKYRPNEDSLFVVQGAMPSTYASTPRPRLSSSWWQMGWEVRAMGERRADSPSSPWLRICLAR